MHLVDKDSPYGSELSGKVNMKSLEEQLAHLQGYNAFKLPYVPNPYDKDCPDKGYLYYRYEKGWEQAMSDYSKEVNEENCRDMVRRKLLTGSY